MHRLNLTIDKAPHEQARAFSYFDYIELLKIKNSLEEVIAITKNDT